MNTPKTSLVPNSRYIPKLIMHQEQLSSVLSNFNQTLSDTKPTPSSAREAAMSRTGWNYRVDHALDQIVRSHACYQPDHSIFGDINRMFDTTLSTLILIASGDINISEEHLLWSEAFLRGVRDRYGKHPPNVRKLLGFIKHIQNLQTADAGGDKNDLLAKTYQDVLPNTLELSKISPPKVDTV